MPHAFASVKDLVNSDIIDLVVVTVKVPYHFELVSAAIEAGKNVHCEWPLGNGLAEAQQLANMAKNKGIIATIGNQMRTSPKVKYLSQLIDEGYVGTVLSSTLIGSGGNWGAETISDLAYLSDKTKGANMLTIPFAHTLAGIRDVLGELSDILGRLLTLPVLHYF